MIDKILGVVCLIAAGAFYTAEHLSMINGLGCNGFVVVLTILGVVFLLMPVWIAIRDGFSDLDEENARLEELAEKKISDNG